MAETQPVFDGIKAQTSFGSALGSIERFVFTFLSPPRQNSNFVWFCARLNRKVRFFELLQVLSGLFAGLQGKNKWLSRSGRFCLRTKARLLGCCMTTKRRHFFKTFIIKILWCNVKTFSHAGQRNVVCLYGSFFRSCLNPNRSLDTPSPFLIGKMRLPGILPASARIQFLATPRRSPLRLRLDEKHAAWHKRAISPKSDDRFGLNLFV